MIHTLDESHIFTAITTLKDQLADFLEPDFGLLDELLQLNVITHRQFAKVRSERTVYERNDAVLDLLTSEDKCTQFLEALRRTGQQHVINYIIQDGGQKRIVNETYFIDHMSFQLMVASSSIVMVNDLSLIHI